MKIQLGGNAIAEVFGGVNGMDLIRAIRMNSTIGV
jgi:hypothetical protein